MKSEVFRGALTPLLALALVTFLEERLRSATGGGPDNPADAVPAAGSGLGETVLLPEEPGALGGRPSACCCVATSPLGRPDELDSGIGFEESPGEGVPLLAAATAAVASAAAASAAAAVAAEASAFRSASCSSSRARSRSLERCSSSAARPSRSAAMCSCSEASCEALARSSVSTASRAPASCRNFSDAFRSAAFEADAASSSSRSARDSSSSRVTRFSILHLLEHS
mmetsp:Transcript_129791/g.229416  ORF Transcript_129791/g.229416 Transcript_129791/m.229416 type:complete len:227 (-) Transcript_129791:436-1116(-)